MFCVIFLNNNLVCLMWNLYNYCCSYVFCFVDKLPTIILPSHYNFRNLLVVTLNFLVSFVYVNVYYNIWQFGFTAALLMVVNFNLRMNIKHFICSVRVRQKILESFLAKNSISKKYIPNSVCVLKFITGCEMRKNDSYVFKIRHWNTSQSDTLWQ